MALAESLEKVFKLPTGTLAQQVAMGAAAGPVASLVRPTANIAQQVAMGAAAGPVVSLARPTKEMAQQVAMGALPIGRLAQSVALDPGVSPMASLQESLQTSTDPEEREGLMAMIEKLQAQVNAPMGEIAQAVARMGGGEDTALAHVRPGEVVVPPEIVQDPEVESLLESKFNQMGINPEEAVVGIGIASLNPNTGLEQFGFFKKIGKKLGKVVKKVAPVAGALMIPGIGGALGGALSSAGSALGIPSGLGSRFLGGKGILDKAASIRGGIGNLIRAKKPGQSGIGRIEDLIKGRKSDEVREGGGIFDVFQGQQDEQIVYDKEGNPIRIPRSGGGFGDMLKMGGIGALAAGLGKLAYDEAKDQRGVELTPLTTMDATGRYNIEAEIARRMGQPAPNPVEFGLLPEGTLPELSGGKPRGMQVGGSVDKIRNLAMRAGQANNTLAELESSFNPNNLMDVVVSNLPFAPTGIKNPLMSSEKKQYDQAKNDFISAILRQETGAVITEDEMEWMNKTYFPQLGDDDDVIALKRSARQQAVDGISGMIPKKTQDKSTRSTPMMMYGGPVMAYAEGGNVAMEDFERMNGRIDGPGTETSDDIPAMLSDGEFVMTGRAVRGAGSFDMQNNGGIVTLTPNGSPDRESGTDLMYQLMEVFSGQARPSA